MNILNKLTLKHLKMNKKRTIVSIIGIILSTALMVGVGLLFSTVRDNMIKEVESSIGSYHAKIKGISTKYLSDLSESKELRQVMIEQGLGSSYLEGSNNEYKPYLYLVNGNDSYLKTLKLVDGRLPKSDSELVISKHIIDNAGVKYNIGDTITLNIGDRISEDGEYIEGNYKIIDEIPEKIVNTQEYEFTIVGIVERTNYESYSAAGYSIFTLSQIDKEKDVNAYITYKKVKNVMDRTKQLVKSFELDSSDIEFNDTLLTLYGETKYDNYNSTIIMVMSIFLGLISIGCIIVIYNSFAISVSERKKQFGLLSSIGATKKQIRKTVFFEATVVGIIGIIIGILSSIFGIGILLRVVNSLLKDVFTSELSLSFYPMFIIIPVIFMIITVLLSAYIPARRASKITPIEAIRQNDDIKIKAKKLKTNKFVKKLFGVEGELALKNIKRNKKKYRITIVSLFISIVLFISFSCFLKYSFGSINDISQLPEYDVEIYYSDKLDDKVKNNMMLLAKDSNVLDYSFIENTLYYRTSDLSRVYDDNFKKNVNVDEVNMEILNLVVDKNTYDKIIKKYSLKSDTPILVNNYKYTSYRNSSRKMYSGKMLNKDFDKNLDICDYNYEENTKINCKTLNNINVIEEVPSGFLDQITSYNLVLITSEPLSEKIPDILTQNSNYSFLKLKINDEKSIKKTYEEFSNSLYHYYSVKEEMKLVNNLVLVIKILLYGFICLVTLIGVTSVFNTITTSIALRRREFAMLRSIGLAPHGFNKILYFESLFFGFKSLLYSLPVSFGVMLLIRRAMDNVYSYDHLLIPWGSVIGAIIGVFIIVLITMLYSARKIKHENILDSIRDENI